MSGQTRTPRTDKFVNDMHARGALFVHSKSFKEATYFARALEIENAELRQALQMCDYELLTLSPRLTSYYRISIDAVRERIRELLSKSKGAE